MTIITGDLRLVSDRAAEVTQVHVRARETRAEDGGLTLSKPDTFPVDGGFLEITVRPGPAFLVLVHVGGAVESVPILVDDLESESLENVVNSAKVATSDNKEWLEKLAAEVIAGTQGPKGERGPVGLQGPPGNPPYISGGRWWTGGVDTGINATGPQGDPGIAPHVQGETWWVGDTDTGIRAQGQKGDPGDKGDPGPTGPTGTLDLIDESAQTTIDTVVVPAIEDARDDALGEVAGAVAAEVDAIKWVRGHVPLDATSISDLAPGSWTVSNGTRAGIVGSPGGRLGNLSIGNIGTSHTATFISQGNSVELPGMWIQSQYSGSWSGWQKVSPVDFPESDVWYHGFVTADHETLNDLSNGAWAIAARPHAVRFGLPADFGSLQLMQIGSSRSAFFIGQETGLWINGSEGTTWGEWKRPGNGGGATVESGAGLKTVPLAVSTGLSGDGELAGRYRVLTQFTAPITRFRVHVSTAHPMWPGNRGPSTLGAVYIGYRSGESGVSNQSTLKTGNTVIPAAGEWVSSWITHDLTRETLIDFQVTADNAYNLLAPAWKQNGSSWEQLDRVPLWLWVEAETYAETPTVAMVGDSTGAGSGSHMPVWDSALHIAGRKQEFLPVLFASSGDTLNGNIDPEDHNYTRWAGFGPYDSVIIQAGSNDVHNGATLAEMRERYLGVVDASRQLANVAIAGTVKPRYPATPDYDATRIAYNNWLKTQPGTTRAVLDFSHAVAPGGAIDPADNADGAHLTSSGHQKMATAFDGVTVAREPLASKAMIEAADTALGQRIDSKAEKSYVDTADQTLGQRITDEKWNRGQLGTGSNIDTLPREGIYNVPSGTVGAALNLPGSWYGKLHELWVNSTGTIRIQQWVYWRNAALNVHARQMYNGTWTAWTQILPAPIPDTPAGDTWSRGVVTEDTTSIDSLADGMWKLASAVVVKQLGLPGQYGNLQIMSIANSRTAWWLSTNGKFYVAVKSGGTWGEFQEVGGATTPPPSTDDGSWIKRLPVTVTAGSAISYRSPAEGTYRVIAQVTAPVLRWRLHVEPRHSYLSDSINPVTMTDVVVGHRSGDHDLAGLTTLLDTPVTIAADGTWSSDWVRHDLTQETLIEYSYTAPGEVIRMAAPAWEMQQDESWVQKNSAPLFIWMEVETYTDTPAVAMLGDSTGVGSGSITAVWDSPLHISARKQEFIPVLYGNTGHGMATTGAITGRNYAKWAGRGFAKPDSLIIQAGSNDIHAVGRTFDEVKARLNTAISVAEQAAPVLYAATIKPRRNPTPENEAVRLEYNSWLLANYDSLGLHGVVDYSDAVAPTGIIGDDVSADDAHLNSAGQNLLAEGLNFPVCRPRVVPAWAA